MSLAPSTPVASTQLAVPDIARPSVDFPPGILLEDVFLKYDPESLEISDDVKQQAQILKKAVEKMFQSSINQSITQKLNFIGLLQCLGISYHFQQEINHTLKQIYNTFTKENIIGEVGDLHSHALLFRLLRQKGYQISSGIFNRFKNEQGNFNETLTSDIQGLCSLYEASHLRTHGDDIMEEACDFSSTQLKSLANQLSASLVAQINHCLRQPINKSVPRFEAKYHISIYEQDSSYNESLLAFAKIDFNILQNLHLKEICNISKWNIKPIESLPHCMQEVFNAIVELCDEIESTTTESGKSSFVVPHFKQAVFNQVKGYMVEAKWCHEGYIPTYDEYKINGILTSCFPLFITSFVGLGEFATEDVLNWISSDPTIIKVVSVIGRVLDDMASHKFEQQRVHVASAVECCMKQYGISQAEAYCFIHNDVEECWKIINEECIKLNDIPKSVIECIVNLARMSEVSYENHQDKYTNSELLKDYIYSLFLDPMHVPQPTPAGEDI
ncbi:(-)-germacrene D synthase isoform X2 [Cajanus cajan]|uniref:(-)-germacrene D synthase isoform X2 n=1 Tax=Cajanus cajan TaxID=3821 RepID=UPI0010FB0A50|nr:(-)-germacrene D synthase isoform X2 [Cajanus cajan]